MSGPFKDEDQIRKVVEGFESCTTAKEGFRHKDHLTVAVWYLRHSSRDEALGRMRESLHRFINHHGINPQKYQEDVTVAWIDAIHEMLLNLDGESSTVEATNIIHERFGTSRIESKVK